MSKVLNARRLINSDRITRRRQTETNMQGAKCKKTDRDCKTRQKQTETEEQGAKMQED